MTFLTAGGLRCHLLFHPPRGGDFDGTPGELPPLVVVCHGGPTAGADAAFDLAVQLWTTRGVAVAVVDYRGSAGHGRAYRRLLDGLWGVADAEDCAAAAAYLATTGRVDAARMVVKGSSAGGLTALRALEPGGPFAAAVVAYPVTDLRALAAETHKFESRYLDRLVGPWPASAPLYEERSPALHPERIGGAVLLLQGEDDPVVPPDQAARLAQALRERGVRCEHVVFPGEGHGFRRADTLETAARLELGFVGEVLGFQPVL
jgi:dipeptidyl aminopeptidase/acylaminoacyl peptidase